MDATLTRAGNAAGSADARARQRRLGGMLAYVQIALNILIALAYLRKAWIGIASAWLLAVGCGALLSGWLPDVGWLTLGAKMVAYSLVYLALMWGIAMNAGERAQVRAQFARRAGT